MSVFHGMMGDMHDVIQYFYNGYYDPVPIGLS